MMFEIVRAFEKLGFTIEVGTSYAISHEYKYMDNTLPLYEQSF